MRTNRKPFHAAVLNRSNLRAFKRRKNFAASFRKSPSPSSRRFFVSIGCGGSSPSNVCQAARNNRLIGLPVGGPRWVPAAARPVAEVLSFSFPFPSSVVVAVVSLFPVTRAPSQIVLQLLLATRLPTRPCCARFRAAGVPLPRRVAVAAPVPWSAAASVKSCRRAPRLCARPTLPRRRASRLRRGRRCRWRSRRLLRSPARAAPPAAARWRGRVGCRRAVLWRRHSPAAEHFAGRCWWACPPCPARLPPARVAPSPAPRAQPPARPPARPASLSPGQRSASSRGQDQPCRRGARRLSCQAAAPGCDRRRVRSMMTKSRRSPRAST